MRRARREGGRRRMPGPLDVEDLSPLFEQVKLTGNAADDAAQILAVSEDTYQTPHLRSKGALPSLELGIKASSTTRQWREREHRNHKKQVRSMQSPTKREIVKHMNDLDRAAQILSFGSKNKANAMLLQFNKIKRENQELARRLVKTQNAATEITSTNKPGKQRNREAVRERMKYLAMARHNAQTQLDFENSLILKRLAVAKTTVPRRNELKQIHKRNRTIRRNMCKLAVPPHEHARFLEQHRKRQALKRARAQALRDGLDPASVKVSARDAKEDNSAKDGPSRHISSRATARRQKSRQGARLKPVRNRTLNATSSEPWLKKTPASELPFAAVRPISRAKDETIGLQKGSSIKSSEDRGQICHDWVMIKHVVPGEQPQKKRALLIGFKKPNEEGKLIFEVSFDDITRYAQVTYEQMKDALEDSMEEPSAGPKTSLAQTAAQRLTLFGSSELGDLALVWNEV